MKLMNYKLVLYFLILCSVMIFSNSSFANETPNDGEDSEDNCKADINVSTAKSNNTCKKCEEEDEKDDNKANDPVSLLGGKLNIPEFDLELNGSGKKTGLAYLYVRRSYSSQTSIVGAFGYNWSSNLDISLTENWLNDYSSSKNMILTGVSIKTESGNLVFFRYDSEKISFISPACEDSVLEKTDTGYIWKKKFGTIYTFEKPLTDFGKSGDIALPNNRCRLSSISDKFNNKIVFEYNDSMYEDHIILKNHDFETFRSYLVQRIVESNTGRYIKITWKDYARDFGIPQHIDGSYIVVNHFISSIKDSSGREVKYEYVYNSDFISLMLSRVIDFENHSTEYKFIDDPSEVEYFDNNTYIPLQVLRALQVTNKRGAKTTYIFNKRLNLVYDMYSTEDPGNSALKVTNVFDALGNESKLHFDTNLSASIFTDKRDNKTVYFYSHGRIDRILYPNGKTESFSYDSAYNRISQENDGGIILKSYDSNHNVTQKIDANGNITKYVYDKNSSLWTTRIEPDGKEWKRVIQNGYIVSEIKPDGSAIQYEYDQSGNIIAEIDSNGNRTENFYDLSGNLIKVKKSNGDEINYVFDEMGNKISETDANGNKTNYKYDGYGNVTEVEYPDGALEKFQYDENSNLIMQTDALGRETIYEYDLLDQLVKTIYPNGTETSNLYDSMGNLIEEKDQNSNTTRNTFDSLNRKIKTIDPLGYETNYVYDDIPGCSSCGDIEQIGRIIDQRGNITSFNYDPSGRLIKTINDDESFSEIKYDSDGNVIQKTDENRNKVIYAYDSVNQLVSITNSLGEKISYTYDSNGNKKTVTDPKGNITTYNYDNENNLVEIIDANQNKVQFAYDKNNNLTSIKDPQGNVTRFEYNARGKVINTINPAGIISKTEYDLVGNVIATVDGKGQRIDYEYNVMNQLIKKSLPDGTIINYVYDKAGNLIQVDDRIGTTHYEYNELNQLVKVTHPPIASVPVEIQYSYDEVGNRKSITYPNGKIVNYTYDNRNRLSGMNPSDIEGASFTFGYDSAGRRTSLSYPNGVITNYSYDNADRLTNIKSLHGLSGQSSTLMDITYTHDLNGNRLTRNSVGAGLVPAQNGVQSYVYDALNQLTKATYENNDSEEFIYDKAGNRLKHKTVISNEVRNLDSSFNNLNQLLKSELEGASLATTGKTKLEGIVQDKNIAKVTVNGIEAVLTGNQWSIAEMTLNVGQNNITVVATDQAGNATTETFKLYFDPKAQTTYSYDLNGNLVQKSEKGVTWNYTWDAENRLIRVTTNDTNNTNNLIVEYGYFDNGNRAYKIVGAGLVPAQSNTYYVNDGVSVIAEYNGQGALQKEYLYSNNIDEVLQSVSFSGLSGESSLYYYHQDGLNSVVAVTDNTGVAVNTYNYEAFGTVIPACPESFPNSIAYTGRWLEPETGDYFYRARYYDAGAGRFQSQDPIKFRSGDYNFYRYVLNDPINSKDPLGLACGSGPTDAIVPDSPFGFKFTSACQAHDNCYDKCIGGKCSGWSGKGSCDRNFKKDMLKICCKETNEAKRKACQTTARIYFSAVAYLKAAQSAFIDAQIKGKCKGALELKNNSSDNNATNHPNEIIIVSHKF